MADDTHDDADEPVIPGPEGELALDAAADGDAGATDAEVAPTDARRSVAPFIDDDDEDEDESPTSSDDDDEDEPEQPATTKGKAKTSKSAVGAAVATSKASGGSAKGASSKRDAAAKKKDDAADDGDDAGPKVTRRVVASKRVTPKGGGSQKPSGPKKAKGKGQSDEDDEGFRSARYTPPGGQGAYAQGPSPWWVPALLFGFLIIGALIIMLNYMGVFGPAQNLRLVIGLAFILAGILTSTQYR